MRQTRSKTHPKNEEIYFSDEEFEPLTPKQNNKQDNPLLLMDEDIDQPPKVNNSKNLQRLLCDPFETQIKQEDSSSILSSLMDLEDLISDPHKESESSIQIESESSSSSHYKSKSKKITKSKKKVNRTNLAPIKIEDIDSSSNNGDQRGKSKGRRKIRTTINEEKIKIMEHLFPYVSNQVPYKGICLSLKDVCKIVDLGYSTILHKYKDYREKGQVVKGLLLKCKDFKRKYSKSLVIENFIKRALKESEFKTAKQLAVFISQNYKAKVNRSIISRHLNEMQRQKVKVQDKVIRIPGVRKHYFVDGQTLKKMKQFCLVYLGLKSQKVEFQYLTVIRLYLVENKVSLSLESEQKNFKIIDLTITATDSGLKEYYLHFIHETQILMTKSIHKFDSVAYKGLYDQLEVQIENHQLGLESEDNEKGFIIYPFKKCSKQSEYRFKILQELVTKKISILTVPPDFNAKHLNFIKQWYAQDVMPQLAGKEFGDSAKCKEYILAQMNKKQHYLKSHATIMYNSIKNF